MRWVPAASGSDASKSMRVENAEAATQLKPVPLGQKPLNNELMMGKAPRRASHRI